ncbi:MAG TPA: hypothetical protein DDW34_08430 [Clostridium sp.]|nr:hypothetical protein [Clostridium sp.]
MNYHKSRTMLLLGVGICLFILFVGMITAKNWIIVFGAIIVIVEAIQFSIFYRCPHCGKSLTCVRGPVPEHCPHCGKELT